MWLQKTDYSKSIQDRTKDVLYRFLKYTSSLEETVFESFGASKEDVLGTINTIRDQLDTLLNRYLDGDIVGAIDLAHSLLSCIPLSSIEANSYFYRARPNETGFLYTKDEMFHIPYELRYKITNQRYSISGLPCLYLGSSIYLCWEELERPDYQKCNFCAFNNINPLWIFDIRIPPALSSKEDIYRICLALACSLKTQKDHTFKLEYIIPQCLLHAITTEPRYAHDGVGICYYSVQFLYQESSPFIIDFDLEGIVSRYYNIVIPAQSTKKKGLSPLLRSMFIQSPSMSLMYRYLMNSQAPKQILKTIDNYAGTQFGLLENYVRCFVEVKKHANRDTTE